MLDRLVMFADLGEVDDRCLMRPSGMLSSGYQSYVCVRDALCVGWICPYVVVVLVLVRLSMRLCLMW